MLVKLVKNWPFLYQYWYPTLKSGPQLSLLDPSSIIWKFKEDFSLKSRRRKHFWTFPVTSIWIECHSLSLMTLFEVITCGALLFNFQIQWTLPFTISRTAQLTFGSFAVKRFSELGADSVQIAMLLENLTRRANVVFCSKYAEDI